MALLFKNLTHDQANLCVLILSAAAIACKTRKEEGRWAVYVDGQDHAAAVEKVARYFRENPDTPPDASLSAHGPPKTLSGVWAALLLALVHTASVYHQAAARLVERYGADAERILSGEIYRCVTALLLHSDAVHLLGNMVGIALFGTAVCAAVGPGCGWLMVLAAGVSGNFANALMYGAGHRSIGASTAVFGAIGLLSAFQFWNKFRVPGQRIRAWLPLAGGVALLGILGTGGQRTDIMAHLFGLVSGVMTGGVYAAVVGEVSPAKHQGACWMITGAVLVLAWF